MEKFLLRQFLQLCIEYSHYMYQLQLPQFIHHFCAYDYTSILVRMMKEVNFGGHAAQLTALCHLICFRLVINGFRPLLTYIIRSIYSWAYPPWHSRRANTTPFHYKSGSVTTEESRSSSYRALRASRIWLLRITMQGYYSELCLIAICSLHIQECQATQHSPQPQVSGLTVVHCICILISEVLTWLSPVYIKNLRAYG